MDTSTGQVRFTPGELAEITGGRWSRPLLQPVSGVTDDSRGVSPGDLFVAVRGTLTDGHRYLAAARAAGAAAVCVEPDHEADGQANGPCLVVDNTLRAYQVLARAHRLRFPELQVVAITGSSGKTSLRAILAHVLEKHWPGAVLATQANTNNHFGVPRNLLRLTSAHRVAVLEIGSNHFGEIAALADLVRPQIAAITTIGPAHLEFFGDLEGVAREKGALLEALPAGGTAVLPGDSPFLDRLQDRVRDCRVLTFGKGPAVDVRAGYDGPTASGRYALRLAWQGDPRTDTVTLDWPIGGSHQACNAAAAAAVARNLGLTPEGIAAALRDCELPGMRMRCEERHGVRWFNDAYNANPESTRASLEWFRELLDAAAHPRPAVVVLGDMLELGSSAPALHAQVLTRARRLFPDAAIVAIGELMCRAGLDLDVETWPSVEQAREPLRERLATPGTRILLKGSRGVGLETLIPPPEERG